MALACTSGALAAKTGAVAATRFDSRGKARVSRPPGPRASADPRSSRKSSRLVAIATAASTAASEAKPASKGEQMRAEEFRALANEGHNMIPLYRRIFDDQLTPILAYRCLVKEDEREAPSFLLESVVGARRPAASRSWARGRTWR